MNRSINEGNQAMKLLTVDDSAMVRKIISDAAAVIGFEALEAATGEEAMQILQKEGNNVSLVLLDWNMPGMNGLEVLQKIKADPVINKIPVMMVTTESERKNIIKAIQQGASNYLSKPFAPEDLITKMMNSLGMEL